jgi:hypothetical protein
MSLSYQVHYISLPYLLLNNSEQKQYVKSCDIFTGGQDPQYYISMNIVFDVRFEVSMLVKTEFMVLWVVAPCSVVDGYKHFRGPCSLHLQG